MRSAKTIAAAIGATLLGMSAVQAAQSTTALNVRSGPSTGYGVVDTLYSGENVDVRECRSNGWCYITHSGPDGWVSSNYLTNVDQRSGERRDRYRRDDNVDANVNFSFGVPGFSFSVGNGGDFRDRPGRPNRRAQVCFYEDVNYRGASFCARPGDRDRSLGSFNDRISSIRIRGDAQVQVCEDYNFNGRCAVLDRSRANIGGRNNDIISSYRVR